MLTFLFKTLLLQLLYQAIQSIDFDFINGVHQHTQFAFGKTLPLKPFQVMNRQITNFSPLVLTKRHGGVYDINENFGVVHSFFFKGKKKQVLSRIF